MPYSQQSVKSLQINLPDVCVASPEKGKAFCSEHCALLSKELPNVPLGLREFISYCETEGNSFNTSECYVS